MELQWPLAGRLLQRIHDRLATRFAHAGHLPRTRAGKAGQRLLPGHSL